MEKALVERAFFITSADPAQTHLERNLVILEIVVTRRGGSLSSRCALGAAWSAAFGPVAATLTAALKKAQEALGIEADGKWGPVTEDAIQKALQPACTAGKGRDDIRGMLRPLHEAHLKPRAGPRW